MRYFQQQLHLRRIIRRSDELRAAGDAELLRLGRELQWQAAAGMRLRRLVVPAFALVREASRRAHGQAHYPTQLLGGLSLLDGGIIEMQTGEGKTLTALLPLFLHALTGRGCHIVTANEYLAGRDAAFASPIFQRLGLRVGCLRHDMGRDDRRDEYAKDVTYGTTKEFGFDLLRDRLICGSSPAAVGRAGLLNGDADSPVQRGHYFALVDEADSVLIDDARTPLIIALPDTNGASEAGLFQWSTRFAGMLENGTDFHFEPARRSARLTSAGCRRVLFAPKPGSVDTLATERLYRQVEWALTAVHGYARDRDYVVADGTVAIVDESTGRVLEGRKWQEGLHQAIESKERLPASDTIVTAARITVQAYFGMYEHLAGLTGTALPAAREFRRTYGLGVTRIATHRPCRRTAFLPRIFATRAAKFEAVAGEIEAMLRQGRPVLVGTPSVESSEMLAGMLRSRGIEHRLLNCRFHREEAGIITEAGSPGRVTIATNMAGRGTDIVVDDTANDAGGLHVIATEMHSSARIDRQLIGRTARQGAPGTFRFFLSLEDELLRSLGPAIVARACRRAKGAANGELSRRWLAIFRNAQKTLERRHGKQRRQMLRQERERTRVYAGMGLDPCLAQVES